MSENLLGSNVLVQVAIVVRDIEEKAKAWAKVLGVSVPRVSVTAPEMESHIRYRGKPTEARAKLAFFDLGEQVRLELIEPMGAPSTWQEFLEKHGEGLHHIAFRVKGMDEVLARLEAHDMKAVQRGDYTGGRYAYVDAESFLGCILELLENF
ncbi:MAG: VOC family protein [Chloroflexi bacterium]|nr:VOC family protein [Chloroflexota bacterium]